MVDNRSQLNSKFDDQGYFVNRNYFIASEISSLRKLSKNEICTTTELSKKNVFGKKLKI